MKTIGFVDYYISEWHANNYPVWIKEICEEIKEDFVVKYVWAELDVSPIDGVTTDVWCKNFGAEKCGSIDELCEKADYIMVLSPSNPEKHLSYAEKVFKYKKLTYIDKTFAPDYETAQKIFDLADKNGVKFFSSSALRYASELDELMGSRSIITVGGGGNFEEYIIHQIEMVVKTVRSKAVKVRLEKQGTNQYISTVSFTNGERATLIFSPGCAFSVIAENSDKFFSRTVKSDTFKLLLKDILRFFNTGKTSFDRSETLEVMKIRTGLLKAKVEFGKEFEI